MLKRFPEEQGVTYFQQIICLQCWQWIELARSFSSFIPPPILTDAVFVRDNKFELDLNETSLNKIMFEQNKFEQVKFEQIRLFELNRFIYLVR